MVFKDTTQACVVFKEGVWYLKRVCGIPKMVCGI